MELLAVVGRHETFSMDLSNSQAATVRITFNRLAAVHVDRTAATQALGSGVRAQATDRSELNESSNSLYRKGTLLAAG
jgi:hypothetical protein